MPKPAARFYVTALASALLLSACSSLDPKPSTEEENRQRILADQSRMYGEQEPVTAPITFYEAAARALKYNLDYRLKLMESALASDLRDVSSHEMLPRLVAGAHWGQDDYIGGLLMALLALGWSCYTSVSYTHL